MQLVKDLVQVRYNGGGNFKNHRDRKKSSQFHKTPRKEAEKTHRSPNKATQRKNKPGSEDLIYVYKPTKKGVWIKKNTSV